MARKKVDKELMKAGEVIYKYFNEKYGEGNYGIPEIISEMMNTFMLQERNAKLKLNEIDDVGNGFFKRRSLCFFYPLSFCFSHILRPLLSLPQRVPVLPLWSFLLRDYPR